jgi:hypothetical protein
MKRKYSKVYFEDKNKNFGYRYNYEKCVLEYISRWDCYIDEETDELVDVIKDDYEVVDSVGLSKDNWKESPSYWVDVYREEHRQEMKYEMNEFKDLI